MVGARVVGDLVGARVAGDLVGGKVDGGRVGRPTTVLSGSCNWRFKSCRWDSGLCVTVDDSSLWTISGAAATPTVHRRDQSSTRYACGVRVMIIVREGDGRSHVPVGI